MPVRILEARERAGLSQMELAERIGVAQSSMSEYETGKRDPKSNMLERIADACNVSVDFLLGREQQQEQMMERRMRITVGDLAQLLASVGIVRAQNNLSDDDLMFLDSMAQVMNLWIKWRG